jgi:hypothetical protein
MTVPRNHLHRYVVVGYKEDGTIVRESFTSGRDAYIMEGYYKRQGYTNVSISISR